jgi:cysteine desulfurase
MAYFDAASAEPLSAAAREALLGALDDGWADPVRLHREGRRAGLLLDRARERVACLLRCRADELAFTSSGTQAVHLGVLGTVLARQSATRGPGHVVVSAVEHSSVLNAAAQAERSGGQLTIVGVGSDGRVDADGFADAVRRDRTVLACLQSANHEVGTIQPAGEIAARCAAAGVPLLVDAAASAGRADLPADWSVLVASAHKWGGPPGVGVMAIRKHVRWRPPVPDGSREGHRVPGFPNLPAIMSAAAALEAFEADRDQADAALRALTGQIRNRVPALVPDSVVHGDPVRTLPHIVTFSCLYIDGEAMVTELDKAGFSVSSGSACAAETPQPSHVLAAMGAITHGNVRVSLPRGTTAGQVQAFLDALPGIVARLRGAGEPAMQTG